VGVIAGVNVGVDASANMVVDEDAKNKALVRLYII